MNVANKKNVWFVVSCYMSSKYSAPFFLSPSIKHDPYNDVTMAYNMRMKDDLWKIPR